MTDCKITKLNSRTVVEISGAEAEHFLQGLVTNDIEKASEAQAIHAALLTPQGKILFDFFIIRSGDGFLFDCATDMAADLIKRLTFYRLRAKVEITDRSEDMSVYAVWDGETASPEGGIFFSDPRLADLGQRLIAPTGTDIAATACQSAPEAAYHAHRITLGVPEGGIDYIFGDIFPHEADYDQLHGVDFAKGCYVGQEVVSRMQHRGTARKRIVPIEGGDALTSGAAISAEASSIGNICSVSGRRGLALIRLDRAAKAQDEGKALEAEGVAISLIQPGWANFNVPGSGEDAA